MESYKKSTAHCYETQHFWQLNFTVLPRTCCSMLPHWVAANSKINLLNTQTLKCWEYYTMRNLENSILLLLLLMLWGHLLFFCSRKGKTRAVGVIKITKCLPYGKHLNIPELFSQEIKTAKYYKILWDTEKANRKRLSTASSHTNWAKLTEKKNTHAILKTEVNFTPSDVMDKRS